MDKAADIFIEILSSLANMNALNVSSNFHNFNLLLQNILRTIMLKHYLSVAKL